MGLPKSITDMRIFVLKLSFANMANEQATLRDAKRSVVILKYTLFFPTI